MRRGDYSIKTQEERNQPAGFDLRIIPFIKIRKGRNLIWAFVRTGIITNYRRQVVYELTA